MQAAAESTAGSEPRRIDLVLQHAKLLTLDRATLQKLCGAEGVSARGSKQELADRLCPVVPTSALFSAGGRLVFSILYTCPTHK